jgi:hypothetical protein
MQYNALASIQWIPLYILACSCCSAATPARRRPDRAAFALVVVTSYYYAWFVAGSLFVVAGYFARVLVVVGAPRTRRPSIGLTSSWRSRVAIAAACRRARTAFLVPGRFARSEQSTCDRPSDQRSRADTRRDRGCSCAS